MQEDILITVTRASILGSGLKIYNISINNKYIFGVYATGQI